MCSTPGQGSARSLRPLRSPHKPPVSPGSCQPASIPSCPKSRNSKPSPGCPGPSCPSHHPARDAGLTPRRPASTSQTPEDARRGAQFPQQRRSEDEDPGPHSLQLGTELPVPVPGHRLQQPGAVRSLTARQQKGPRMRGPGNQPGSGETGSYVSVWAHMYSGSVLCNKVTTLVASWITSDHLMASTGHSPAWPRRLLR